MFGRIFVSEIWGGGGGVVRLQGRSLEEPS